MDGQPHLSDGMWMSGEFKYLSNSDQLHGVNCFCNWFFLAAPFFCLFQFFNWLFLLHMFLFSFHLFDGAPFRAIGFFQSICNNKMPADLMGNDDSNRTTTTSTAAPASTVKNNICHKVNWFWCESMIVKSTSNER